MNYADTIEVKDIIKRALKEDIGRGDITTGKLISKDIKIGAVIQANERGIICGIDIARLVFKLLDNRIKFSPLVKDGDRVTKGRTLIKLSGLASNILSSERVALNFLGFLSGIATRTREFIVGVRPYNIKIMDTRKTLPGLRKLEKYAVKIGGGCNHRYGLDEMVLVKDNHIRVMGYGLWVMGLGEKIRKIKREVPSRVKIEVEVNNLKEFEEALKGKPDIIMLDNMKVAEVERCVRLRNNLKSKIYNLTPKLEASGNINFKNIRDYAATGIDFISLGTLTKDIQSLDISLEVERYYT